MLPNKFPSELITGDESYVWPASNSKRLRTITTLCSLAFNINFFLFLLSGAVSRSARFFLVGYLIKIYGEPIQVFIEKYFNILAILFTLFLIGGFFIIKVFI